MGKLGSLIKNNLNALILTIYVFMVWSVYLSLNSFFVSKKILFLILIVSLFCIGFISVKGINYLSSKELILSKVKTTKQKVCVFFVVTAVALGVSLLWLFAYYPGCLILDCVGQYVQATSQSPYNDWHPVWHTLLFFKLPLVLTGAVESIVFFQIIYYSLTIGYMGMVIYKHTNIKWTAISIAYIFLNPHANQLAILLTKDVGFAIAGCLAMTMATEIYFSKKWANKWWKMVLLGVVLANATLFRHNAVLFTVVFAGAILFFLSRKQAIQFMLSFLVFIFVVKGPVYSALNVGSPNHRVMETTGLPLTIIGNVVKEAPERLDDETLDFAYSVCSKEQWETMYTCGSFNSIKWCVFSDTNEVNNIDDAGFIKILKMTARCFINSPKQALRALLAVTYQIYGIEDMPTDHIKDGIKDYMFLRGGRYCWSLIGVEFIENETISSFLKGVNSVLNNTILKYISTIGLSILMMIVAILSKSNLRKFTHWKRIFICIPIITYDFLTMLLLSGPDVRFFSITFLVCPLILTIMFGKESLKQCQKV